jgi:hypothetical protein
LGAEQCGLFRTDRAVLVDLFVQRWTVDVLDQDVGHRVTGSVGQEPWQRRVEVAGEGSCFPVQGSYRPWWADLVGAGKFQHGGAPEAGIPDEPGFAALPDA